STAWPATASPAAGCCRSTRSRSTASGPEPGSDATVARVEHRVARERDQPRRDDPEHDRAKRARAELRQRLVEPDRLVGVVVDGRPDDAPADEGEDDRPREVADDADRGVRLVDARAHLPGLRVLAELLLDPLERLVDGDAEDDEARDDDEVPAERPVEHAAGRLLGLARAAAARAADQDLDRREAQRGVGDAADDAGDAVLRVVLAG